MAEDTYACKHCPAVLAAKDDLKAHTDSFHPAGAAAEIARVVPPGTTIVEGKDFGPAVSGLASELGDVKSDVADHEERLKAIEDGTRSSTDLDALVEQLLPRLRVAGADTPAAPATSEAEATPVTDETTSYADLQARAKELGIPATGSREALEAAIADEEAKTAGSGT